MYYVETLLAMTCSVPHTPHKMRMTFGNYIVLMITYLSLAIGMLLDDVQHALLSRNAVSAYPRYSVLRAPILDRWMNLRVHHGLFLVKSVQVRCN